MPKYKEIDLRVHFLEERRYCVAFCYPVSGPLVIKGDRHRVLEYINRSMPMCHFNMLSYKKIDSRTGYRKKVENLWMVNRRGWTIKITRIRQEKIYRLMKGPIVVATFKRVPKRFIKEFELYDRANIIYKLAQEIQHSEFK